MDGIIQTLIGLVRMYYLLTMPPPLFLFPRNCWRAVSVKYGRTSKYKYASERFESSNLSFNTST